MMKKVVFLVFLVVCFALPVMADDAVVAVVQGQEITADELDSNANISQLVMQIYQMDQQFASLLFSTESGQDLLNEYRKAKLDEYIYQILLNQEVEQRGITLTKEDQLAMFREQLGTVIKQNNLTEDQLTSILQQQGFESLDDYQEFFLEQNGGMMAIGLLRDEIVKDAAIEDSEVQEYYLNNQTYFQKDKQVHARHILLPTREQAEEVLAKIKDGADFAEMAKEYSTGPTGPDGGDLGFFGKGQMVAEFEEAAFAMQAGEVSDIVQTDYGFHIIKVDEIQPESIVPFEEAKDQIKTGLLEQKRDDIWNQFVNDLKTNAEIEIRL